MGIRYYAYPVDPELVDIARNDPRAFISDDPLMDAWGPLEDRPPMLYLDKAWGELQILFNRDPPEPERAAMSLVRGNVTHTNEGWIPYLAVLGPDQVTAASVDLATITESDVGAVVAARRGKYPHDGFDGEARYILHYLRNAQTFCADLSQKGAGLVYEIG